MTRITRRAMLAAPLAAAALGASASIAAAQTAPAAWPTGPLRMIVPFGAGGGSDVTARLILPRVAEILGQPIVIENRGGAGGTIGSDAVAKARPDGTTFLYGTLSTHGLAVGLYGPRLTYDPVRDFTPIAPTVLVPIGLIVRADLGVTDLQGFIRLLRANPGRFNYGSSGAGASGHLAAANFVNMIGAQVEHIPFRGGSQVFTALLAGQIQFAMDIPSLLAEYHKAGTLRTLAMAVDERSPLLPDVPTMAEAGLPNYKAYSWFGVWGPAGLARPIVDRFNAAINQALADPALARRLNDMGLPPMGGRTPEQFDAFIRQEIDLWVPIVRASGATAQ